jgi:hypothetical protein
VPFLRLFETAGFGGLQAKWEVKIEAFTGYLQFKLRNKYSSAGRIMKFSLSCLAALSSSMIAIQIPNHHYSKFVRGFEYSAADVLTQKDIRCINRVRYIELNGPDCGLVLPALYVFVMVDVCSG